SREDLPHGSHHGGWPGNVINRSLQAGKVFRKDSAVYKTSFSCPLLLRFSHFCHRGYKAKIRIGSLQLGQRLHKRRVLWPSIGIEEVKTMGDLILRGLAQNAQEWRYSYASGQEDGGFGRILMQRQRAAGAVDLDRGARR